MKPLHLLLMLCFIVSCTSQKNREAYIKEIDYQSQLLDTGAGLKKDTIVSGISSGGVDRIISTVSVAFDPEHPEYIKIVKKTGIDYTYNNQFYYKNQKLIKAKINIKNNTDSGSPNADYSAVYYLHRNRCIKKVNEDPEKSDCHKVKYDSDMALLDGLPLIPRSL
ncbi:hypothetical protein [Chryseobacterium sp. 2987]|uniref:hypothetical protein n=1 Tax=Chryseobacterium sp. 2987 TaxID=2817767 RepID=UPI002867A8EA|nr:hypothetical protein [Chryseobacterium sp. 2987]MDR6923586.1 tetrahydromethanopterin S-methyltransferase subunit F [Chryseobacterium sp. 2987]